MTAPPSTTPSYWTDTRRPIYSAALVLPFLLTYEIGLLLLKPDRINGGDVIIQRILGLISIQIPFLSAVVLLACFVVWQVRAKGDWKLNWGFLQLAYLESLACAIVLFLFMGWLSRTLPQASLAAAGLRGRFLEVVLYCGAGVYEELVFRVLLLGLLLLVFTKLLHMETFAASVWSVILGALLFSLFHYLPGGDTFHINSFLQRAFAGVFFAALFVTRSFGVAAASHALYDILVGFQHIYSPD